ncbi:D-ribose pyranase [Pseudomonas putida S11]|nr:D-ribose pyranase [Pseudomonas putida S11]
MLGCRCRRAVELIDLAVTPGLPDFASVLRVVLSELQVERHVLAEEMQKVVPPALVEIERLKGQAGQARMAEP